MYLSPSAYPLGRLGHCDAITGTKAAWGHSEPASGQAVTQLSPEGRRELKDLDCTRDGDAGTKRMEE